MNLKIVFFGTPPFAADCLEYLLDHHIEIVAIVTQPDRPKGRSLQVTPSAVKSMILEKAPYIPIFQPEKASTPEFIEQMAAFKADLFVVVVYGQILAQKLLDIPPLGCINVHPSLLPKFRGAAPIQRAIMAGETETGVSIQKLVRQMDAGDVIDVTTFPIPPDMVFGELQAKLLDLAKPLLLHVIHKFEKGMPGAKPQNPDFVTFAPKIEIEEGEIHWDRSSQEIHNLIRAFSPRPGAWVWIHIQNEKKRLKILRSKIVEGQGSPGELLSQEPVIACGQGALQLIEVQPEGKKAMKAADWMRGMQIKNVFVN